MQNNIKINLLFILLLLLFGCESFITEFEPKSLQIQKNNINDNTPELVGLEVWEFSHYEPIEGKIVAIWPRLTRYDSISEVLRLKEYFGFSKVVSFPSKADVEVIQNSGAYSPENIVIKLDHIKDHDQIKAYEPMGGYYFDEPVYFDLSVDYMNGVAAYIREYAPNAEIGIGDFHYRNTTFTSSGDTYSEMLKKWDYSMFTSYKEWREFLGFWVSWPEDPDQRSNWTDMQNLYGSKFNKTWIAAHLDESEFFVLIKHAKDLGLNEVWLYQLSEDNNSDAIILSFCEAAWKNEFLRKFLTKRIYTYIPKSGEETKTIDEIKDEGRVEEIIETGKTQEIIYNSAQQFYPYIEK